MSIQIYVRSISISGLLMATLVCANAQIPRSVPELSSPQQLFNSHPEAQRVLVILHDVGQNGRSMAQRVRAAYASGSFDYVVAPTYDWQQKTIPEVAPALFNEVRNTFPNATFVLDGYGKGGLVARWIVERTPEAEGKIERVLTTSTPNNGADVPHIVKRLHLNNTSVMPVGLTELEIGSETLKALKTPPINDARSVSSIQAYEKWQTDVTQDSGLDGLPDYGDHSEVIITAPTPSLSTPFLKDRPYSPPISFTPQSPPEALHTGTDAEGSVTSKPKYQQSKNVGAGADAQSDPATLTPRGVDQRAGIQRLLDDNEEQRNEIWKEIGTDLGQKVFEYVMKKAGEDELVKLGHAYQDAYDAQTAFQEGRYLDGIEALGKMSSEFAATAAEVSGSKGLQKIFDYGPDGIEYLFKCLQYLDLKKNQEKLEKALEAAEKASSPDEQTLYSRMLNGNIPPEARQGPIELSDLKGKDASQVPPGWIPCQCPGDHPGLGIVVKGVQYHSPAFHCPQ
jgi:hypothetical protein